MRKEVIFTGIRVGGYAVLFWLFVFGSLPMLESRFYRFGILLDLAGIAALMVMPKVASLIVLVLMLGWGTAHMHILVTSLLVAASAVVMMAPLPMPETVTQLAKQLGHSTRYFDDILAFIRSQLPEWMKPLPLAHDTHGIERTGPGVKRVQLL